jgi:excisionase family DNA binding protein
VKRADIERLAGGLDYVIAGLEDLRAVAASLEADDEREREASAPPAAPQQERRRPDGLFTAPEVAGVLSCHIETVYKMIERGELSALRIGNQWRIEAASIPGPARAEPFDTPPPRIRVPRRSKYGDDTLVGQWRKREREAREEDEGGRP